MQGRVRLGPIRSNPREEHMQGVQSQPRARLSQATGISEAPLSFKLLEAAFSLRFTNASRLSRRWGGPVPAARMRVRCAACRFGGPRRFQRASGRRCFEYVNKITIKTTVIVIILIIMIVIIVIITTMILINIHVVRTPDGPDQRPQPSCGRSMWRFPTSTGQVPRYMQRTGASETMRGS